jgi:hypothetical protein
MLFHAAKVGGATTETHMGTESRSNHGEGNPEAANEFNSREQEFVNSASGKKKIAQGAEVRPEDEASLLEAEHLGRQRSKGDDPKAAPPPKK